jgi:hypothetical protein
MQGDIVALTDKETNTKASIQSVGGAAPTKPVGERSSVFFDESMDGVPRRENLFAARFLGQTTQIQLLKDIIKNQVASTDFHVQPAVPEDRQPTDQEIQAADAAEDFLMGNFNTDRQSFDHLLMTVLDDLLDIDSGILELVSDEDGFLEQIIPRDGLTFTKNVDENGLMPAPDSGEPAFYQFSLASHAQNFFSSTRQGIDIQRLREEVVGLPFSRVFNRETKEFSRDQIVWFEESPRSHSPYGVGRTQKVKRAAEIMINGDLHRNRFFQDNEFHKGFLKLGDQMSQDDLKRIKRQFSRSGGNEYEMQVFGGVEDAEYVSIDPNPEEMQFLESQKFYTKMVIMAYGLNESEAGLHDNANLAVSEEMKFNVFRRTTNPLLTMIERKFNNEVLPFMREYNEVDGNIKFEFDPSNRFLKSLDTELVQNQLDTQTVTVNEAREELGKSPYDSEIGDVPLTALESYTQQNPASAIELLTDLDDVPEDAEPGQNPLFQNDGDDHDGGGPSDVVEAEGYREVLKQEDSQFPGLKDALRNEQGFEDVDGIVGKKDEFKEDVAEVFEGLDVDAELEDAFPNDTSGNELLVDADKVTDALDLRQELADRIQSNNEDVVRMAAEFHADRLESEAEERVSVPEEMKVEISFDLEDTFTLENIRNRALEAATEIEESVKDQLRRVVLDAAKEGLGIPETRDRIEQLKDSFTSDKAELVARTETLSSSRRGSQALAESTDLVRGKEWIATDDNRTREWHSAMDGTIIDKDGAFTVPQVSDDQPSDYPRTARIVGEDQPFNCRCSQAPVLREDMPSDATTLEDFESASVAGPLTERQLEIWSKFNDNETSFAELWNGRRDKLKVGELADRFGMSKSTVYKWDSDFKDEKQNKQGNSGE